MSIRRWWGDDSVSISLPKVSSCQTMLPGTMGRNREIKCKASSRWLSVDMTTTFSHVISCFSGCGAATATKEVMKSKLRGRMGFISGTVVTSLFKRVSVTAHYINFHPSVQARRAFCCKFPAFLLPMAQKLSCKGRICSKGSPWSAGAPSYPVRLRVALWGSCYAVAVCRHRFPGLHFFFVFNRGSARVARLPLPVFLRPLAGAPEFRSLTRAICPTNSDLVFMYLIMPTRAVL